MLDQPRATIVVLGSHAAELELIEQTLRESGDRVLATTNPLEAFELGRRIRIDLLIGERALLEGQAEPLLEPLHSGRRDLRILYLGSHDEPKTAAANGERTLPVPFSLEELREAVETALGRHA